MDDKSVTQAVEQRHRDAAADFPYYFGFREVVRKGMLDTDPLVQAFAKFEAEQLASRPDNRAELEAALREDRSAIFKVLRDAGIGDEIFAAIASITHARIAALASSDQRTA